MSFGEHAKFIKKTLVDSYPILKILDEKDGIVTFSIIEDPYLFEDKCNIIVTMIKKYIKDHKLITFTHDEK